MRQPNDARKRIAALLLLTIASLLIYGRTMSYPFVLDDPVVIVHNDFLRSPGNFPLLLVSDYERGTSVAPGYFRPLMMITFATQGILFGWDPGPFHLINVLLHGLTAWALYLAACDVGCGAAGAFVGALLFTVFPPGQEAVASVVGRCDILAALFYLLGWRAQVLWQRGSITTVRACASVFSFGLLAMLGKESGVVYAGATCLTAAFFVAASRKARGPQVAGRGIRGQVKICVASFMALTAYLALHQVVVGGIGMQADVAAHTPNPVANLVQPLRTYFVLFGIGRLLLTVLGKAPLSVPLSLTHGGPFPSFGPLDLRVLLPAVIVALLVVVACHQISRGRLMGLALAMFLINLIPASNLVVTPGVFVAERFLYLPFVGLGLAAAITWDSASTCFATDARVKRLGLVAVGGFIVVWGGLASERATIWKSEETISESMGQCFPWQGTWWDRVGQMNMEKGDLERAWECFERSAAIDPNDAETLGHLGAVLGRLGRWEESSLRLRRAAEMAPSNPEIRIALARALLTLGEKQAALEEARAGHALRPSLFAGHQVFATALFENGRYEEAAREFRQLLLQRPESAPLRQAYISSLSREGRLEEAEAAARDASRQIPSDPQFDLWSARLATRMGRRDQAFAALEEAKRKSGPVAVWLEKVDDLKSLRDDPRARALGAR